MVAKFGVAAGDTVEFTGVKAAFGGSGTQVQLSGQVLSTLFSSSGAPAAPLFFSGSLSTSGSGPSLTLTVDPSQLPNGGALSLGVASFAPTAEGSFPAAQVVATPDSFEVELSGVLTFTGLTSQTPPAITISGLDVGTHTGIASATYSGGPQQFSLFGATLTINSLSLAYNAPALSATIGGSLVLPFGGSGSGGGGTGGGGSTINFTGLKIGTDGAFSLTSASLAQPVAIVAPYLAVNSLGMSGGANQPVVLNLGLQVHLPSPFDTTKAQQVNLSIGSNGQISGSANIVVIGPGASGTGSGSGSSPQISLGPVSLSLQYLGLNLESPLKQSQVQAVIAVSTSGTSGSGASGGGGAAGGSSGSGAQTNVITLGSVSGNAVKPGLAIGFDGSVTWGNATLAKQFTFNFDVVSLQITGVSIPVGASGFEVGLSGQLGFNLSSVSGGLNFQNFTIGANGVSVNPSGISGGSLTIASVASVAVSSFGYGNSDTTIAVPNASMPTSGSTGRRQTPCRPP